MVVQMAGAMAVGVTGVGEIVGSKVGEAVGTGSGVWVGVADTAVPVGITVAVAVGDGGAVRVGGTAVTLRAAVTAVGVGVGSTLVQAASSRDRENVRVKRIKRLIAKLYRPFAAKPCPHPTLLERCLNDRGSGLLLLHGRDQRFSRPLVNAFTTKNAVS